MGRRTTLILATTGVLLAAACSHHVAPPTPGTGTTPPPPLAGRPVMVLPVQPTVGPGIQAVPGLDADIAYFLSERAASVHWILPAELERALRNSPTLNIHPGELAVAGLRRARLERIGEPLFTDLRNLGLLVDARWALLPYAGGYVAGAADGAGRVELQLALIDTSDGDVVWLGAVAGQPGPAGSPLVSASAASALAELLGR